MPLDIDRFCHGLFAYLYQHYKDSPSCELAAGLPVRGNFYIPDDFDIVFGDSQILVNKTFRRYFRPIFDRASAYACRTEKSFKDFVTRRCSKIRYDSTEVSILTICAVVSELNLYCFQRDCFRFASFAPRCLSELLRESNTIVKYLTSEPEGVSSEPEGASSEPEGASSEPTGGYGKLKEYCEIMLTLLRNNPSYIPGIFEGIGRRFEKMKDKPVDFRMPLKSTMSAVPEGEEEDEDDETAPLVDLNLPPPSPGQCRFCRGTNCSSYIQEFESGFVETEVSDLMKNQ